MISEFKSSFKMFFKKWVAFSYFQDEIKSAHEYIKKFETEKQSIWGKIAILEEQQEIMHNFLVEINKYLVNLTENKMGYMSMGKEEGKKKMHESKKEMKKSEMGKKEHMKKDGMKKGCK